MTKTEASTLQDDIIDLVRKNEEAILTSSRRFAHDFAEVTRTPAAIREMVNDIFRFTESVLKSQRDLAHGVLDAVLKEDGSEETHGERRAPRRQPKAS